MASFCIAVAALFACDGSYKAALWIQIAAGAGAAGCIVLLFSAACAVTSIFCFGMMTGIAMANHF